MITTALSFATLFRGAGVEIAHPSRAYGRAFAPTPWKIMAAVFGLFRTMEPFPAFFLYGSSISSFESVCTQLMAKFPRAQKVIITLRGSINANHNTWGGVLYSNGTLYQSPRYNITHIVDRVGGGDSFMGGLIYGLISYPEDDQRALNFAVAASCLKHTIYGDYNQVTVAEVENLMKGDGSGRVSR